MPSAMPAAPARMAPAPVTGALGLVLPTFPQRRPDLPDAATLADVCRRAEALGAGGLWACDHLYWHTPALEAFAALGVAVSATARSALGTCVLQLPLRHVPSVAKESASLAQLSAGRFVLGVGVGTHPGEYAAAGADFSRRGRRLDEGVDALRRLWREPADERYAQRPAPGPVPVWVGGSSPAAVARAGHRGDGWIPLFLAPDEYAAAMSRLDETAERAGRDPAAVARAVVAFVSMGGGDARDRGLDWMSSLYGLPSRAFARHLVAGDARACASTVARFVEAGAQHVALFVADDDPLVQFEDLAGEFAGLVACFPPARGGLGDKLEVSAW